MRYSTRYIIQLTTNNYYNMMSGWPHIHTDIHRLLPTYLPNLNTFHDTYPLNSLLPLNLYFYLDLV